MRKVMKGEWSWRGIFVWIEGFLGGSRKGHVRQEVTKSTERVHKNKEREEEPQEFHVGLFCHVFLALGSAEWIQLVLARNRVNLSLPFLRSIILAPLPGYRTGAARAAV